LPRASYRLWTLSVPFAYRLPIAADPSVLSDVLRRFIQEVFTYKRRQTHRHGVVDPTPAAVTFCQRFGSILNLHPHFHVIVPDGVFVPDASGRARWVPHSGPSGPDIEHLATRVAIRLGRYFEQDLGDGADAEVAAIGEALERPGLPAGWASQPSVQHDDRAIVEGVSLHVGKPVAPDDRAGLERMIRYGARPAFAQSRLSITPSGKVSYRLRRPWYTGQTHVTLDPVAFLRRLAALIPPPRIHLTRFHGAFAPRSKLRRAIFAASPCRGGNRTTRVYPPGRSA
jgi:hypothetical protein